MTLRELQAEINLLREGIYEARSIIGNHMERDTSPSLEEYSEWGGTYLQYIETYPSINEEIPQIQSLLINYRDSLHCNCGDIDNCKSCRDKKKLDILIDGDYPSENST